MNDCLGLKMTDEEIRELMRIQEEDDALSSVDLDELSSQIADEKPPVKENKEGNAYLKGILDKFGV